MKTRRSVEQTLLPWEKVRFYFDIDPRSDYINLVIIYIGYV